MKECVKKWLAEQIGAEDETLLRSLYDDYRETVRTQLVQARADLAAGDFAALDRTAHALKGAALTVGDKELLQVVLALRDAAKACAAAGAVAAADRLDALAALL